MYVKCLDKYKEPQKTETKQRVCVQQNFSFTLNRFLSVRNFAQQSPGKDDPDGRFVHGRFVPTDVLSSRTFCLPDVLSDGRFLSTDVLSPDVLSPDVLSGHLFSYLTYMFTGVSYSSHSIHVPYTVYTVVQLQYCSMQATNIQLEQRGLLDISPTPRSV